MSNQTNATIHNTVQQVVCNTKYYISDTCYSLNTSKIVNQHIQAIRWCCMLHQCTLM